MRKTLTQSAAVTLLFVEGILLFLVLLLVFSASLLVRVPLLAVQIGIAIRWLGVHPCLGAVLRRVPSTASVWWLMYWLRAALSTVSFVVLGLATVWVLKNPFGISGDATLVFALVLPLLAYLMISGKLAELRGPGGLVAKFQSA